EHLAQRGLGHIAAVFLDPINGSAEFFVIGAHGLGNGPRSPSGPEEMPCGFLAGSYFCKGSINVGVKIYSEGLCLDGRYVFKRIFLTGYDGHIRKFLWDKVTLFKQTI